MSLDRKTFLRRLGAGAVGLAAGNALRAQSTPAAWPAFDAAHADEFWRDVRALYPLRDEPIYLNTGGLGPASQPVLDAVERTSRHLQEHSETGHDLLAPARATVARFLGAQPEELCFVRNATE